MVDVIRTLARIAIYKDEAGEIQVRAYYIKAVALEDVDKTFSAEVVDLIPNWGLEAKWNQVQAVIEQV